MESSWTAADDAKQCSKSKLGGSGSSRAYGVELKCSIQSEPRKVSWTLRVLHPARFPFFADVLVLDGTYRILPVEKTI